MNLLNIEYVSISPIVFENDKINKKGYKVKISYLKRDKSAFNPLIYFYKFEF